MEDWVKRAVGRAYRPTCCICGCDIHMDSFGAAKRKGSGAVFWHDRCYRERHGKTPEQYEEMKRAELQTELDPEQQEKLESLGKGRKMAKTTSVNVLVFDDGKVWRERKSGYRTADEGLLVCKTDKRTWKVIDSKTGLHVGYGYKTKREAEASLTEEVLAKTAKYRESHRYRGAVRANELVWARGSMPKDEYVKYRDLYAAEELEKFKEGAAMEEKVEQAAKEKAGAEVEVEVTKHADVTAVTIEPPKNAPKAAKKPRKQAPKAPAKPKKAEEKGNEMDELKKQVEELMAELKATRKELDEVWKENAQLKAKPEPKPEPKPEVKADVPTTVTLEAMQAWANERNLVATQKREGTCIWVEGDSKEYADELKELGFRFAKKRKSWYLNPAA